MLDYLAIFKKLNEKGIRYIVVGGIAVNLYGIPRMTYDIDLILDLEDNNIEKFLRLLKGWGFKPRVPVDIMDFAKKDKRDKWIKNKNMKAFNLVNPKWAISEIDVVIDSPVDYEKAHKRINNIKLHGVTIPVASIDDLIKMKEATERQQDKADIRYLKEQRNEKK
ncbi:MAG: nucleotidyltransferase [Nitrospirota bacterium]